MPFHFSFSLVISFLYFFGKTERRWEKQIWEEDKLTGDEFFSPTKNGVEGCGITQYLIHAGKKALFNQFNHKLINFNILLCYP